MSRSDAHPAASVPEELRQPSQAAADLANAMLGSRAPAGSVVDRDRDAASAPEHEEKHHDSVPEALRHTSEVAAELMNRVWGAIRERAHIGHHLRTGEDEHGVPRRE